MKKFALVFVKDLKDNGLGYIWLWKTEEFVDQHKDDIIFVEQAENELETNQKLLVEVKKLYPKSTVFQDTHFTYINTQRNYIKTK